MKTICLKPSDRILRRAWRQALDVDAYDAQLARAFRYIRQLLNLSLMEVERRSGLSHQFWSNVEKQKSSLSAHNEAIMCNTLCVRPSRVHRLAERWVRLGRRLHALLLWLLPLEADFLTVAAGA